MLPVSLTQKSITISAYWFPEKAIEDDPRLPSWIRTLAQVRFNPTGNVQVFTGTHSHGQGHETTFAQLVTEQLGVPIENIEVIHGDTSKTQFGMGTYGSRSLAVGGVAIAKACEKLIEKGKKIAAHALEAAEGDIEFADGNFAIAGTDKAMNLSLIHI